MSAITAMAGWLGSNRLLAPHVGEALQGCSWVGIPFAGSMSEVPHIKASSILINDKHRHIINMARCVANDNIRPQLLRRLRRKCFHPEELADAQQICKVNQPFSSEPDLDAAEHYFVCCWMGRASKAGTDDEFNGRTSTRWSATGGSSVVRYFSAIRALAMFSKCLRLCAFETTDAFDFLARCEDLQKNGVYCDPPFPVAGRRYLHNAGQNDADEAAWHARLAEALVRFDKCRVVCRFYDHPLIRKLYPEKRWLWRLLTGGKKQTNGDAPEVLVIRNAAHQGDLFA